jgi:hypothetical protein
MSRHCVLTALAIAGAFVLGSYSPRLFSLANAQVTTTGQANSVKGIDTPHGKCVGVATCVSPGSLTTVYRAFDDGTVETFSASNDKWEKVGK